jgi:hypothetical protein
MLEELFDERVREISLRCDAPLPYLSLQDHEEKTSRDLQDGAHAVQGHVIIIFSGIFVNNQGKGRRQTWHEGCQGYAAHNAVVFCVLFTRHRLMHRT